MRLAAPVTSATFPARDDDGTNSFSFAFAATSYPNLSESGAGGLEPAGKMDMMWRLSSN
jgi:hypothetical protein